MIKIMVENNVLCARKSFFVRDQNNNCEPFVVFEKVWKWKKKSNLKRRSFERL